MDLDEARTWARLLASLDPRRGGPGSSLSARDLAILLHLTPGPADVGGVVRDLGYSQALMSTALEQLRRRGLICLMRPPSDRRRHVAYLTTKAIRILETCPAWPQISGDALAMAQAATLADLVATSRAKPRPTADSKEAPKSEPEGG